jgi:quinol monooxygenase YgiN
MTDERYVVIATVVPEAQHTDAVRKALLRTVESTHGEAGCLVYALHETTSSFVIVEVWESKDHHAAHRMTPHTAALLRDIDGKLSRAVEGSYMTPVPYGVTTKGSLVS